jgi:hypothetical protein
MEKQKINYPNAYEKRTLELDSKLRKLYLEWKSRKELSIIFERNIWWITSRLRKLWVI